jgi:hypothetical protein
MTDPTTLLEAYEAIYLAELRGEIDRRERDARIVALRDSPLAAGLSFEQREAKAKRANDRAAEIIDEVFHSKQ